MIPDRVEGLINLYIPSFLFGLYSKLNQGEVHIGGLKFYIRKVR